MKKPDPTAAARVKRARGKGKFIALTLTDPSAIQRLAELTTQHGSQRAAIESALTAASAPRPAQQ